MILNSISERAYQLERGNRALRAHARSTGIRQPLVVVPPCFGTRLVDDRGRIVWGTARRLYYGPTYATWRPVRAERILEHYRLIPGLYSYDVFGRLLRFLERVGGYRRGKDLFIVPYDWRQGLGHAASCVARLVNQLDQQRHDRFDVLAISSGGAVLRHFLAGGGQAQAGAASDSAIRARVERIRRIVYLGAPQRGTFSALRHLQHGITWVRGGTCVGPDDIARSPTVFEMLPHPDETVFLDAKGAPLSLDLYRAQTWKELRLVGGANPALADKLAAAAAMHRESDRVPAHSDTFAIAARHLATPSHAVVLPGRVFVPACCLSDGDPDVPFAFCDGDGTVPANSLAAIPGLPSQRMWWTTPKAHHLIVRNPQAHTLVVKALFASAAN